MTRVHVVKHARKDYPEHDIKKGDQYYWWKFRFGGKNFSKTPPDRRRLTQSDFQISMYDLEDALGALVADDSIESQIENVADQMESLADEQEEKVQNMPDQLQDSEIGQMLQERADALREWAEELRGIDIDIESDADDYTDDAQAELYNFDPAEEPDEEKRRTMESEIADRAQEMADEAKQERIQEIVEEAQGTSYGGP